MFRNKKLSAPPEINATSMADIAFLLVLFFLMTSTILDKKGIYVQLPEDNIDTTTQIIIETRNVFDVSTDSTQLVRLKDSIVDILTLPQSLIAFVINPQNNAQFASAPEKAVISLKFDASTSFQTYVYILDELKKAIGMCREYYAKNVLKIEGDSLTFLQRRELENVLPLPIYENMIQ